MHLLDKQGVTGSSPVSPILPRKDLGEVVGDKILKGVTILWPKLLRGIGKQITVPLFIFSRGQEHPVLFVWNRKYFKNNGDKE